jgi:hypothetical protein
VHNDSDGDSDVDSERARKDNWDEWEEEEESETICLFCEKNLPTPQECLKHAKQAHSFDLRKCQEEMSMSY